MRFSPLTILLMLGCLAGCGPAARPVWHPDSQSFYYARADGAVAQYDLGKKASRTLLPAGGQRPRVLALSPKSADLAFAQAAIGPEGRAVQVGIAPLAGGQTGWSKLEVWGEPKVRRVVAPTACHWCPTGRRVLVWYQQSGEVPGLIKSATPFGLFAVYDTKTRQLSELDSAPPAATLAQVLGVSPLAPDGAGYLAMKLADDGPRLLFVGWDGWEYPLSMSDGVREELSKLGGGPPGGEAKSPRYYPLPAGAWSGNALEFATAAGAVSIDLGERKVTLAKLSEAKRVEFEAVAAADAADKPWTTLQVAPFADGETALHCRFTGGGATLPARVELVDSKRGRRRVVLEGTLPDNFLTHHLFPSPDGAHVLACLKDEKGNSRIHVVRPDGTVVATVDAGAGAGIEGGTPR